MGTDGTQAIATVSDREQPTATDHHRTRRPARNTTGNVWIRDPDRRRHARRPAARDAAGRDTRPTADRVREALFTGLDSTHVLDGRRFPDLYAGSGAVGLEAASRGAAPCCLSSPMPGPPERSGRTSPPSAGHVVTLTAQRVTSALAGGPANRRGASLPA